MHGLKRVPSLFRAVQAAIAEKMGVTTSAVSLWERNICDMSARQLDRFCELVGVKRDDIFLPSMSR